ncbi:hypothetical protein [Sabulicella rubraurantiaca]|uniref:hypothetical protein n=1 Tax=Sabulicella rubraurantiaca TaxID=2811429 RepID=UPI001A96207C|nr:hypothetical protein [Sabulicella rubraurantiaca]
MPTRSIRALLGAAALVLAAGTAEAAPTAPYYQITMSANYTVSLAADPTVQATRSIQLVLDVSVQAYNQGYSFSLTNLSTPGGYSEQTTGLLGLRVMGETGIAVAPPEFGPVAPALALDLSEFRLFDFDTTKTFSFTAGAKSLPSGSLHFNDSTDKYFTFNIAANGQFTGARIIHPHSGLPGVLCNGSFDACYFSGAVSPAVLITPAGPVPVPAPTGFAFLALGMVGLGIVRRGQAGSPPANPAPDRAR